MWRGSKRGVQFSDLAFILEPIRLSDGVDIGGKIKKGT